MSSKKRSKPVKLRKRDIEPPVKEVRTKRPSLSAKTENQKTYIKSIIGNDVVFCQGPAGTGKTHIAVAMAVKYLDAGKIDKIIIARPVVEAGEKIGFLPGDQDKKLDPYIRPILDELGYYASYSEVATFRNSKELEVVPIGYMRGRTFKNTFVIVDECQNATFDQLKMIITRLGESSKMVLTGDIKQSDLMRRHQGAFQFAFNLYNGVEGISCVTLTESDIQRHKLVGKMLEMWENQLDKTHGRDTIKHREDIV